MLKRVIVDRVIKSILNGQLCVRSYCVHRFVLPACGSLKEIRTKCQQNGFVLKSPYPQITVPNVTIDQYVWKDLSKWENHIAIECWESKKKFTYSKLRDHCAALAIRLRTQFGLERNDVIGLCMANHPGNLS